MARLNIPLPAAFPFRLDLTVWALRRRKSNIIDRWDGRRYTRILLFKNAPVRISIVQDSPEKAPELSMSLEGDKESADRAREPMIRLVKEMLGLDLDLRPFYALTKNDVVIGGLVRQFCGVKPPRFPTIFEALLNAIACQQVSLDVGIILLDRLAERYGRAFDDEAAFPAPEGLASIPVEEIKKLGFSYQKARAIKELAAAIASGNASLERVYRMSDQEAIKYLSTLRGIGRWSAEYVLLRGLGRLDSFPADDIGARNNLQRLFHLDHKPGYGEIKELTSRWHPYEGLVYFHLLLNKLQLNGII
ncbi:putative DNA glycosidase [Methanocella paludicola SANAE]|uniref:DNA glycosidase n=1 Tax=Methanocella paludicola (strain DSM 17711 / JCM 13418 / NBRC 101707 / SANAE) TaxID=304371 RepID=D1Z1B8_METPS|nr:DNA-3-methyladenine glycosylase [Methanocella paludicola]BAI62490.1 putative DNA glycosidase [Methanocella paludicola SANAE]